MAISAISHSYPLFLSGGGRVDLSEICQSGRRKAQLTQVPPCDGLRFLSRFRGAGGQQ